MCTSTTWWTEELSASRRIGADSQRFFNHNLRISVTSSHLQGLDAV